MELKIDFLTAYDQDTIKAELRRIAKVTGKKTLTKGIIDEYGRVNALTVINKFGSLREAHIAARLVPGIMRKASDLQLLTILVDTWTITQEKFGRSPAMPEVRKYGFPITGLTISKRFGGWNKALLLASKLAAKKPVAKKTTKAAPEAKAKRKRARMSTHKRFVVFKRDGYTCKMCKRRGGELHVDHVVPFCKGGSDQIDNLQTLCKECNLGKRGNLE